MPGMIQLLYSNPKRIFLIDGLGALTTAILLLIIKKFFIEYFGLPPVVFTILASIAFLLSVYSLACALLTKRRWKTKLYVIGIANLLYCCLTLILMIHYYRKITAWSLTYFLIEIIIIVALILFEFKAAVLHGNDK